MGYRVRVSEMYDLCTTTDKIGLIGIHTPTTANLSRKWNGFLMNHKFMRVLSCDVKIACASYLPADPLQVSTEAGSIAPQDMMNPILYRAVSNDSFNFIIGRLYAADGTDTNSLKFNSDPFSGSSASNYNAYYAMLSDDGWRKAMPQQGLSMRKLRPLVHEMVSTFGNMEVSDSTDEWSEQDIVIRSSANGATVNSGSIIGSSVNSFLRGKAKPFPRMPCTLASTGSDAANPSYAPLTIPKTYVACIVMPPAKLCPMYYRLIVTWYIEFSEPCSLLEKQNFNQMAGSGSLSYAIGYTFPETAKSLDAAVEGTDDVVSNGSTLDTINVDPTLVMDK